MKTVHNLKCRLALRASANASVKKMIPSLQDGGPSGPVVTRPLGFQHRMVLKEGPFHG
jgi:hypothetical protein